MGCGVAVWVLIRWLTAGVPVWVSVGEGPILGVTNWIEASVAVGVSDGIITVLVGGMVVPVGAGIALGVPAQAESKKRMVIKLRRLRFMVSPLRKI